MNLKQTWCLLTLLLLVACNVGFAQQLCKLSGSQVIMWTIPSKIDNISGYSIRIKKESDTDWTYLKVNDLTTSHLMTPYLSIGNYQVEFSPLYTDNSPTVYESLIQTESAMNYPTNTPSPLNTLRFKTFTSQPAAYPVLVKDDFSSGQLGVTYPGFSAKSVYANDQPQLPGQSLRINLNTQTPPLCNGSHWYGGRKKLPSEIPYGNRIWYRLRLYHPRNQTWGYAFGGRSDDAAASACGQNADGNTWLKHMVLAPKIYTIGRIYLSPAVSRRDANQRSAFRLIHEYGPLFQDDPNFRLPIDRWFTLQVEVLVSQQGYMRLWLDDDVIIYKEGPTMNVGNSMLEWGIGDYWNGVPFTDGAPGRDHFWIKDVVIATDAPGYGMGPTDLDKKGNRFISPLRKPRDFV